MSTENSVGVVTPQRVRFDEPLRLKSGAELPAFFCNREDSLEEMRKLSMTVEVDDPVWPLPLWDGYRKELRTDIADISSTGNGLAGAINAALFMREFVEPSVEWMHLDLYAWEPTGKPGKPKGGADTGLRALYALLEKRYDSPKKKKATKKS